MPRYIEVVRARDKHGPPPSPLLGEAEDSAHGKEVPGAAVQDRAGRHSRRPSIINGFQYRGRHGGAGGVGRGMQAKINIWQGRAGEKLGENKGDDFHTGLHLGTDRKGCV